MNSQIRYIDNDTMIEVTVSEDGFTEKGYVSSMHLVDTKIAQLLHSIRLKSTESFSPFDDPLA